MEQKKRDRAIKTALLFGCVCFASTAFAAASAQMLANNCVGCHGPDGNSLGPAIPSIAGKNKNNFVDVMDRFKSEPGRYSTIMGRIARGYDNREIELLAEYFSTKKRIDPVQVVDEEKVARGAKIHEDTCRKCHEDPTVDDIILKGQWKPYLLNSMHDFSQLDINTIRMKDMKKMVKKLKELSADDRQAVVDFYASRKFESREEKKDD